MAKMEVTPWEVKGDVNYDKLITQFGLKPLKHIPKGLQDHILFRRGYVFAHRDYEIISEAIEKGKPFNMMTGLMPTGRFHIGHMMVAQQMIAYQKLGAKLFICVADIEAYNAREMSLDECRKNAIEEYILNYIALGLEPENCEIYFQSERSSDAAQSNAYYGLQNRFARHVTANEFKGVYGDVTPGKMVSSLLQAADMFHPQLKEFGGVGPTIIPVGADQDPHLRLARDLAKRVGGFVPISTTAHKFVVGLKGGKMSSSDPNSFIALTDDPATVKKKINKYAFSGGKDTLEEHREKGGDPDIDVAYQYMRLFEEDGKKLADLAQRYRSGDLLSGEMKKAAIECITSFMVEHHKKLKEARKRLKEFGISKV